MPAKLRMSLICALLLVVGACEGMRPPANVGDVAPKVYLYPMLQAEQPYLKDWTPLRGRVVVLDFWSTWCPECVKSLPHLNKLAAEFAGKPVQFILITNENLSVVREFMRENRLSGWIGIDEDSFTKASFHVNGIPQTIIVDKTGHIVKRTFPSQLTAADIAAHL